MFWPWYEMITGLLKRRLCSHFCQFSEWWHTHNLHLFLFIDTGRRINVSLYQKNIQTSFPCIPLKIPRRSYYIMIINTYFKFDDLEGILGKISKGEKGCPTNRHYEEIYRHLGKRILDIFRTNGYIEPRNSKAAGSK